MTRVCKNCAEPLNECASDRAEYCSVYCGNYYRRKKYEKNLKEGKSPGRYKAEGSLIVRNMLSRVKYRAAEKGLKFDITHKDLVIPEVCPILKIPLELQLGKGRGLHPNSPSVDRINPKLGYIKGNVRVISARANLLKSDATITELVSILEDLRKLHETPTES